MVVAILLASADETFASLFNSLLKGIFNISANIKLGETLPRIVITLLSFIYLLCFFTYISLIYVKEEKPYEEKTKKDNFNIKVILGALNVIYLIFCISQIKSLLDVSQSEGYAYYARKGFFQLMIVSFINLVTILIAKKSEKGEENKGKYIKIMSLIMILFTFIILVSAAIRMYTYERAFGYTLLRLLVYSSLLTEAVLLVPTILYVIDKKVNLPKAYFVIIVTAYTCMNVANFDNLIAKRNVDRLNDTGKIDIYYLQESTGTDAAEELIKAFNSGKVVGEEKNNIVRHLKKMYTRLNAEEVDFRNFNISKMRAKKLIEESGITFYYHSEAELLLKHYLP